ncbi:sugar phosphate isomerase/epimerase family protein [Agreia sp. VKM Ac-1783]|uniref:sugar phosphate isomerase/epimerase family protein n=1 Tax=Agreia sp. VKM Ac-1783 TaxID=1938889 RepID=UPI000A2AEBFB|nr:sugar phosphate isomerase/epimerase family protein [Agreia sp. VKM Ac-1783]SMQ68433.1 Sugar phosphate isomerase/epimerase [Agreia sp. VKM Ac-1783]
MPYSADTWPIAVALLQFSSVARDGTKAQDATPERWAAAFHQVARAGFRSVDLTDVWVRAADLQPARLRAFAEAARSEGLSTPAISLIRRSVLHASRGDENLDYSHRAIDAAALIGASVVSVGLHQELTSEQKEQLWFWTVTGHQDPVGDPDMWARAVARLRELGRHAQEVGVLLSLEMYEDTYLGTADSAVHLVEDVGLDSVGLNPDTGNLLRLHRAIDDWRDVLERTLPYANYWHVKNYQRDEDRSSGRYTAVPSTLEGGVISYREALDIALSCGFQGVICCEQYGGDGLSVSGTNQRYLRSVLPETDNYVIPQSRRLQLAPDPADLVRSEPQQHLS